MTSVKGDGERDRRVLGEPHFAALAGNLMREIRDIIAAEDWGGLRPSHFRLLSDVPPDGVSVSDLAARLGMTRQGCGQFVDQLRRSGHLAVSGDATDRRLRVVTRTAKGDRAVRDFEARMRRLERVWARRVGRERYAEFRAVLIELANAR